MQHLIWIIHLRTRSAAPPNFRRAHVPQAQAQVTSPAPGDPPPPTSNKPIEPSPLTADDYIKCAVCKTKHVLGSCPLKVAGVEYCNLCGIAHYGHARVCPHITSETQVRAPPHSEPFLNLPQHEHKLTKPPQRSARCSTLSNNPTNPNTSS
jgi:chromodomain-helicase-DNA-binding protein 4